MFFSIIKPLLHNICYLQQLANNEMKGRLKMYLENIVEDFSS